MTQPAVRALFSLAVVGLRDVWLIATGLLRELSDESAYARHLAAHGRVHSPREWRQFLEERLRAKYMRAKCC